MASAERSTSQKLENGRSIEEAVRKARQTAIEMMKKAGFDIGTKVKVVVDPKLPFMGYTMPQGGSFTIVVSGGAVGSGLLEGLLVHEMSHVTEYRRIIPRTTARYLKRRLTILRKRRSCVTINRKLSMIC